MLVKWLLILDLQNPNWFEISNHIKFLSNWENSPITREGKKKIHPKKKKKNDLLVRGYEQYKNYFDKYL